MAESLLYVQIKDLRAFYKTLLNLKKEHAALWNGREGGIMNIIKTANDEKIFAFSREKGDDVVYVVFNFTKEAQKLKLELELSDVAFKDVFSENELSNEEFEMQAWEYRVYIKK